MSRIFVAVAVAVLLLGAPLAADLALQNPDVQPDDEGDAQQQEQFIESIAPYLELAPLAVLVIVVGVLFMGIRSLGGV